MIERRYNYVCDLVYDVITKELYDLDEVELFMKVFLADVALNLDWSEIEDLVTKSVNYASEVYENKDELLDMEEVDNDTLEW